MKFNPFFEMTDDAWPTSSGVCLRAVQDYVVSYIPGESTLCVIYTHNIFEIDFSDVRRSYLSVSTVLLGLFSFFSLVLEGIQIFSRKLEYFIDIKSYLDICVSFLTFSFIASTRTNSCFCSSGGEWQLGAAVIFLAWIALILLMRGFPFTAIPINMLLSITRSFFKVFALPILLIATFGLPLFLLLHIPVSDILLV